MLTLFAVSPRIFLCNFSNIVPRAVIETRAVNIEVIFGEFQKFYESSFVPNNDLMNGLRQCTKSVVTCVFGLGAKSFQSC